MNTSNLCEMARLLADSKLISVAHFVQIIISIFCLLSIAINLPLKCLKYEPVALHKNLKVENLKQIDSTEVLKYFLKHFEKSFKKYFQDALWCQTLYKNAFLKCPRTFEPPCTYGCASVCKDVRLSFYWYKNFLELSI
jgi:hypothetical protein